MPAIGKLPGQRGTYGPGDGLDRPRARKGHYDPGQEHGRAVRGPHRQHRRYARARRLRGRGGARPHHGGRGSSCSSMPARGLCPRPASCCASPRVPPAGAGRHQTRWTVPTPARPRCWTTCTTCSSTSRRRSPDRFPVVYCNARTGQAALSRGGARRPGLKVLFELLVEYIPAPEYSEGPPVPGSVANLDASPYVGRLAICPCPPGLGTQRGHGGVVPPGPDGEVQRCASPSCI